MNEMLDDWNRMLGTTLASHGHNYNDRPIAFHKGVTISEYRHKWQQMPIRRRVTYLVNSLSIQEDPDKKLSYGMLPDGRIAHAKSTPYMHLLSMRTSDINVLKWLVKGNEILPFANLRDVVEQRLQAEPATIEPCRTRYLDKSTGIVMSLEQFLGFASLFMALSYLGRFSPEKEQCWIWDERTYPVGITARGEPVGQVISALVGEIDLTRKRQLPELGSYPIVLAMDMSDSTFNSGTDIDDTQIRLVNLHPQFLREQMPGLRRLISPDAVNRIDWNNPDLGKGVLGWMKPLFMPSHPTQADAEFIECLNRCEEVMNDIIAQANIAQLPPEAKAPALADSESSEPVEQPIPVSDTSVDNIDRRLAKRLERKHKLDRLPNVLEGLNAFDALWMTAENGFFEQSFTGKPMVVDRLRYEAVEGKLEEPGEEPCAKFKTPGPGSFDASLIDVVKGKLVFAQKHVFGVMRDRRYNARAMLKLMKRPVDRNLPDIQVLAPHEFGQVPGFVAGQYRPQRDRLCTVMITYDPELWELSLRERKILIDSSKAPKLWVFPSQWLAQLSSAYNWWDAAYFGTPRDPAILDFVIPNGDYDI